MMGVKENLKVHREMDIAWNTGNLKKFWAAHMKDVIVNASHLPAPTKGLDAHRKDVTGLIAAFPDMKVTTTTLFGQGEWVAAEGVLEGTHKGPLAGPGRQMIPATNKRVRLPFCELTRMENGKIAEERVYFDLVGMLTQLGLMPNP